jgi:hypothetical protein
VLWLFQKLVLGLFTIPLKLSVDLEIFETIKYKYGVN